MEVWVLKKIFSLTGFSNNTTRLHNEPRKWFVYIRKDSLIAVRGTEANKHSRVQRLVGSIPFHLAMQPSLPHGTLWPLSHSTVLPVRCVGTFCKLCTCPSRGAGSSGTPASGRRPHPPHKATGWNPLGAQPAEFLIKEMLCTNARDFIVSFVSCLLRTEKAVSEHALTPPCTETHAHAVD